MIISDSMVWKGQKIKLVWHDCDSFDDLPKEKLQQSYGVCFYGDKLVITKGAGKWNIVGGHIEKFDLENGNPISISMLRELEEEVSIGSTVKSKVLGYVNDDFDDVGSFHFGILYIFETTSKDVKPKDPEIDNGKLRNIKELEDICLNPYFRVEGWSKIALEPLKRYLLV